MATLLQNCDLPPPLRVHVLHENKGNRKAPSDKTDEFDYLKSDFSSGTKVTGPWVDELRLRHEDTTALLRAMHLSQTRAREAESKASIMSRRCEKMGTLLMEECLKNFSNRQWIKLLEIEISMLEKQIMEPCAGKQEKAGDGKEEGGPDATWYMALTLFLGLAGMGIAVGYRYLV